MSIGTRIKSLRIKRGLTLLGLEKLTGIKAPNISAYESDVREPRASNLILLCDALKCTSDYLLGIQRESAEMDLMELTLRVQSAIGVLGGRT